MGTTKLTRKEIMAEDKVHASLIWLVEFCQHNGTKIAAGAVAAAVLAFGVYSGIQYLNKRERQAQEQWAKGLDFFHGSISADATNDPYGKGLMPAFRTESEKYQAAAKEFSPIASGYGYGSLSVAARFYLALSQLQLGQKKEAIQNLVSVAGSSRNRTIGFLAKKALATEDFNSGNYKGARQFLEELIRDPQCDLAKEDLSLQLSRVLMAEGKRDEAIKALEDAKSQGSEFGVFKQQLMAELARLQKGNKPEQEKKSVQP